jgi:hypothetical protein
LVFNLLYQVVKFLTYPFKGIIFEIVEGSVEGVEDGLVLLVGEIVGIMEGLFLKDIPIIPVKRGVAIRAEHLETP